MNILDRQEQIANAFKSIHKNILSEFKQHEREENIIDDVWEKPGLGIGHSVIIDDGEFFDKAGINFSNINGESLPNSSVGSTNKSSGLPYFATGVSVVFHPKNPNIPTSHLNIRYFCTYKNNEVFEEWFGGGFDLTPYVLDEDDCRDWHKSAKNACDLLGKEYFQLFKKNCDEYFFLAPQKRT
jgi:coproporphyrinogen III oxidase